MKTGAAIGSVAIGAGMYLVVLPLAEFAILSGDIVGGKPVDVGGFAQKALILEVASVAISVGSIFVAYRFLK